MDKQFRVIVAGGRLFENYKLLKFKLDKILKNVEDEIVIVSGCAKGADSLGEKYAKEKGYKISKYPANWDRDGRAAGPIRNTLMANNADALVAFWDKSSSGTRHMISIAEKLNLKIRIVYY